MTHGSIRRISATPREVRRRVSRSGERAQPDERHDALLVRERSVLPDHLLRGLVGEPVVVVRDPRARRDQHVADALPHLGGDGAEQPCLDGLGTREHPRSRRFRRAPGLEHRVRRTGLGVEVKHPRFAADQPHPLDESVAVAEQHVSVSRDVDHAVVGRDDHAGAARERAGEAAGGGIHPLQCRDPFVRLPPATVADAVEFRRVEIDEGPRMPRRQVGRQRDPVVEIVRAVELRAAERRGRESGAGVLRLRHCEARPRLGERRRTLPRQRQPVRVPAAQLVQHVVRTGDACAIAHDPVLTRSGSREQAGQRRGRRAGEDGARDIPLGGGLREEPGVSGSRREVVCAQSVEDEHDGARGRREPLRSTLEGRQHLRHDTGEAPGPWRVRG